MKYSAPNIDLVYDEKYWNESVLPILKEKFDNWFSDSIKSFINYYNNFYTITKDNLEQFVDLKLQILNSLNPKYFIKKFLKEQLLYIGDFPINYNFLVKTDLINKIHFKNNVGKNSYTSSWSFFNNNIVINKSMIENKKTKKYMKITELNDKYLPFANDYYRNEYIKKCKKKQDEYSFYNMNVYNSLFALTNILGDLEFSYKHIMQNEYKESNFENKQFNKLYKWNYNNEQKMRMIFTPWFMENYLRINNKKVAKPKFQLNLKKGLFFSNEYIHTNQLSSVNNSLWLAKFYISNTMSLDVLKNGLFDDVCELIKDKYDSLAFLTILPIIFSEDQTHLYNEIMNNKNDAFAHKEDYSEALFVINESMNFFIASNYIKNDITIKSLRRRRIDNIITNDVIFSIFYISDNNWPTVGPSDKEVKDIGNNLFKIESSYNMIYIKLNYSDYYYYYSPSNKYSNTNLQNKDEIDEVVKKLCQDYEISHFAIDDGFLSLITNKNKDHIINPLKLIIQKYNDNL